MSGSSLVKAVPQSLFLTTGIKDDVSRQNFEALNKIISKIISGEINPPANIIVGPTWIPTSTIPTALTASGSQHPSQMQIQITTKGNPVRLKVAAAASQSGLYSALSIQQNGAASISAVFGWQRFNEDGTSTTVNLQAILFNAEPVQPGQDMTFPIPLPAFECDDIISSGTYRYQFFYELTNAKALFVANLNAVAYELR